MAKFNEILVGRVNRGLQKLFGIKGEPPVPTLASEVMPVHQLFNGVENRFLESWERHGFTWFTPAVVGQNSGIRWRNPAGSNLIAVLENVEIGVSIADTLVSLRLGATGADLSSSDTPGITRIDARGRKLTSMIMSHQSAAPGFGQMMGGFAILATQSKQYISNENQELTALPGDAIQIDTTVTNEVLAVSFIWRERFLEDSERA